MMDYYSQFVYTDQAIQEAKKVGIEPICKYVIDEISYTGWCVHKKEMMMEISKLQDRWEKTMTTLILRKIIKDNHFTWYNKTN